MEDCSCFVSVTCHHGGCEHLLEWGDCMTQFNCYIISPPLPTFFFVSPHFVPSCRFLNLTFLLSLLIFCSRHDNKIAFDIATYGSLSRFGLCELRDVINCYNCRIVCISTHHVWEMNLAQGRLLNVIITGLSSCPRNRPDISTGTWPSR
jgi:hypothetical protein